MKLKTVVVDLDGTLCEPNLQYEDTKRRYGQAKPKLNVIEKLRQSNLYIIIHTARRMKTHKGDIEKIKKDVEQITMGQQIISLKVSADYIYNQRLNIKAFYDKVITNPFISTTYPGAITNAGISLRFTLAG